MSAEIFQSWQQINIQGSGGRAELTGELLPWSGVEVNAVWHAVLIWTALTQDALSHTQGKCKSVLITWVSQTRRARSRGGMLLRQQNFHSFWPAVPHRHRLSPRSTRRGPHRLVAAKSDMFGGSSALIRQHSFLVIHVYSPTCFAVFLWPLASQLDLSGVGGERRKIPLGTFLTHPSRLKNSLYTAGKLIGPAPKPESPSATVCLRLTADKVWQQGL